MSTSATTSNHRKSLKRPDEFMAALTAFFDKLAENSKAVVAILGVFFAFGLGATLLYNARESKVGVARDALFSARQSVDKALTAIAVAEAPVVPVKALNIKDATKDVTKDAKDAKAPPKPAPPDAAAVAHKRLDVDAKLAEGVTKLKAVITDYKGTRPSFDAALVLGDLYFDHGDAAKAVPWYQAAADQAPANFEKAMAIYSLAYAFESAGKYPEALQSYEKSMNLGEPGMKGDLLLAMARTHAQAHDTAKARTVYDQILSQLPNTEYSRSAEMLKGLLE